MTSLQTFLRRPCRERIHLSSWGALRDHLADGSKAAGYRRLMTDFGVDAAALPKSSGKPRLMHAEQAGCWLTAEDLLRARLLAALKKRGGFDPQSGSLVLARDGLSHLGIKRLFLRFHLGLGSKPVDFLGPSLLRRYQRRTYDSLALEGTLRERLAAVFSTSEALLEAAAVSPAAFARRAARIFDAGVRPGLRSLLPRLRDRRSLEELGRKVRRHELDAARGPLGEASRALHEESLWPGFWRRVNRAFLGAQAGDLGPLLDRFLLAVADPVRMARKLAEATGHPPGEPIAVAAVVVAGHRYGIVDFDPERGRFFLRTSPGRRGKEIRWPEVRARAEEGQSGGPATIVEYLMLAARGFYLVADPRDGFTAFEKCVRKIHLDYTGLPYPWVALGRPFEKGGDEYLVSFGEPFGEHRRATFREFFEP